MSVLAILPCMGRHEQTTCVARRLIGMAGSVDATFVAVVAGNDRQALRDSLTGLGWHVALSEKQPTYWQALKAVTDMYPSRYIVGLANDLLPGAHWLRRGVDHARSTFGDTPCLSGFNDGIHEYAHSPHFLIDRQLLESFGGWPTWYRHNYGDTELCLRAQEKNVYTKAPWAVLYHDHAIVGARLDSVYLSAVPSIPGDARLFDERRSRQWA